MEHGKITLEVNDGIGLLTLNDPGSLNAWGVKMRSDFTAAIDQVENAGSDLRCVILPALAGRFHLVPT